MQVHIPGGSIQYDQSKDHTAKKDHIKLHK